MDYCKAVKSLRDVIGVHNQNLIDDERLILNQAECISKLKEELIQIKTAYAKSLQSNAYMFDQNKHYRALIDSQLRGQDELRRENSTLRTKLEENNIKKRSSKWKPTQ